MSFGVSYGQFAESTEVYSEVSGFVFEDLNKNRNYDTFEKGIPGVLVSNGYDVVETDKNGHYSLGTVEGRNIVFVIKPSGWKIPLSTSNLPRFYHSFLIEKADESQFSVAKPGGIRPESINFPMYKTEAIDNFEFIVFADPQAKELIELYYLRDDIVSELMRTKAEFGITLGDIMYDDLSLFDRHNEIISKIGVTFYNLSGNHDMDFSAPDDKDALQTFSEVYGPTYYAFEYGKVSFIVLDDVEWTGKSDKSAGNYRGFIGENQLEWIRNYLKFVPIDNLIVLAMHIPLYYSGSSDNVVNVINREELFNILKTYDNVLAIAGHMHMIEHAFLGDDFGWKGKHELHQITCSAASGSWWTGPKNEKGIPESIQRDGAPNGYHIFTVKGNTYQEYHKAANYSKDFQMRLASPLDKVKLSELDTTQIIVNVFNGSERSMVEYSIDHGKAIKMDHTIMKDPYTDREYSNVDSKYHKSLEALRSTHMWTSDLPPGLTPGLHSIKIRTVDLYGNVYELSEKFEIE